jgi:hypothetical protein
MGAKPQNVPTGKYMGRVYQEEDKQGMIWSLMNLFRNFRVWPKWHLQRSNCPRFD